MTDKVFINSICGKCAHVDVCSSIKDNRKKCGSYLEERPHGEWIPCSERLPKRDELVLVSYKTGGVHLCKYLDDGSENPWWSYIDDCCAWNNTVDAWMPLPEPYKKEGE